MRKFIICMLGGLLLVGMLSSVALAKRPVMAVDQFKNTSGAGWWRGGMGWELAGALSNELGANGKFKMVERKRLQSVIGEQDLAASGRIRKGTGAKIGQITGAQFLVMGTVTAYEEEVSGGGGGIRIGPVSLGGKKEEAYIAVDLRVVDTTTGDIVASRTVEARSSGGGINVGVHTGYWGANLGGFEKTPAGKAVRACMIEIVEYLECVMVDRGDCLGEYQAKEQRRRTKTKSSISLDD